MKFAAAAATLLPALLAGARASKSGKKSYYGKGKGKGSKSSKTAAPTPAPPCMPDLQEGFDCGMDPLSVGLWAGNEKYPVDGAEYDYCSQALWNPANGKNFLTWNGGYLGAGGEGEPTSCADVALDPLEKTIDGSWLPMLVPGEQYILNIEQVKCLPAEDCDYDVLSTGDFPGFTVAARTCNAHLKIDVINDDTYSCELTQFNLLEDGDGRQELVAVLSYSHYSGGYGNYACPMKPAYGMQAALDDPIMEGNALFVLQAIDPSYSTEVSFNTTAWHCPNVLGD